MAVRDVREPGAQVGPGIKVDFGIITIRDDEFRAALDFFKPSLPPYSGHREYNLAEVETLTGDRYHVAIVRCVEPGTGEAQEVTRDMIDDLRPRWIIVLGIAGGVPTEDFSLGDVVVSTRVHDFSVEAVLAGGEREFSLSGGPVERRAGAIVANLPALEAKLGDWNSESRLGLPRPIVQYADSTRYTADEPYNARVLHSLTHAFSTPRAPIATSGEIASSDRLIKDFELLQVMQRAARKIVAVEMEAAGVYRASRDRVTAISIRGISDIVGFKRDEAMTKYACRTAASFCLAFLRTKPISVSEEPTVEGAVGEHIEHPLDWAFRLAALNIASYGDTDIFPFPVENLVFRDSGEACVRALGCIHETFSTVFGAMPPAHHSTLAPIGHTGFRWATQLDPLWNAYLLSLVIAAGPKIEAARIPIADEIVFSYRFAPTEDGAKLFAGDVGWISFQQRSLALAKQYPFALKCDIADFYQRVSHDAIEVGLASCGADPDIAWRIRRILNDFTVGAPVGLPVGGPAARLLSELVLNSVDQLLRDHGVPFCRYCDDFHIFAKSEEESYQHLVFLGDRLQRDHGLGLQKLKTRLMGASEFRRSLEALVVDDGETSEGPLDAGAFLRVRLRFDPYSATAVEDYEKLASAVERFDILGMLSRELTKSRIHDALVRRLLAALQFLKEDVRNATVATLIDNLNVLTPVLPTVLIVFRQLFKSLDPALQDKVQETLAAAIERRAPAFSLDANLGFALRVLAEKETARGQRICVNLFDASTSPIVRRDVILIEAKWGKRHWLASLKQKYRGLGPWERRAFIVASYALDVEGETWRAAHAAEFNVAERLVVDWGDKVDPGSLGFGVG